MTTILAKRLAERGQAHPTGEGVFSRRRVSDFPDLKRIEQLPRRVWQEDPDLEQLQDFIVQEYGLPPRECEETCVCRGAGYMTPKPVQAMALMDAHDFRGAILPIKVGGGKTLISMLLPVVMGVQRPLLLVPAKLRAKTHREFTKLKRHWKSVPIKIMSYELLGRDRGQRELNEYQPDLIMADEAQRLKNSKAACTRRVRRYFKANPDCAYVDMSGTMMNRSLVELHHRSKWALPGELVPLPWEGHRLREVACALDEKVPPQSRLAPGPLMRLATQEEVWSASKDRRAMLQVARAAWGRRFCETPGVVGTAHIEEDLPPILIDSVTLDLPEMVEHFQRLRSKWETPSGEEFSEASDLWRHAREMACGFYYRWDPPAPPAWREARSAWKKFAREILAHSKKLDTEMQVAQKYKDEQVYRNWVAIRDTFKPNPVPVWLSDAVLKFCAEWAEKSKGIVWVEHRHFGFKLAEMTGLPYFANLGIDPKTKKFIEDHKGPCIASVESNKEGRNLQYLWHKNLIVSCAPTGDTYEQLIGRTHRHGQDQDVEVTLILNCLEQYEGYLQAKRDAEFAYLTQRQPQKLLLADDTILDPGGKGPLWTK